MATEWALKKAAAAWMNMGTTPANALAELLDEESAKTGEARELLAAAYIELSGKIVHASDCATSMAPAYLPGRCNCDA